MTPANSWSKLVGLNSPKATLTFVPNPKWLAPLISVSFGKSFFTEDPREGSALDGPTAVNPVETARSYQFVASRTIHKTDLKLTLGHVTQTAEYSKIDPDQGLQFDLGPGRIRFQAATVRQTLHNGSVQATFEQADARLVQPSFSIVPEAPRLIGDVMGTYEKLPFHLGAKGEFEYVGRKVVGNGCSEASYLSGDLNALNYYYWARPTRSSARGVAAIHGWAHQPGREHHDGERLDRPDQENFAAAGVFVPGSVGLGSNGLVPANPVSEVVGVRIPSYASLSVTYHFGVRVER